MPNSNDLLAKITLELGKYAALWGFSAGLIVTLTGWITCGRKALVSAAIGALLVVVFFALGQLFDLRAGYTAPAKALILLLFGYAFRIGTVTILLVTLLGIDGFQHHLQRSWLVLSTVVTALAWATGMAWFGTRQQVPIYDLSDSPSNKGE